MPERAAAAAAHRAGAPALVALLVVAALLRLLGLNEFPRPSADEGGWVLETLDWVRTGRVTEAFAEVPGYVLQLAPWLGITEPPLHVARHVSVLYAVLRVGLLFALVRHLVPARTTALACAALLAAGYAAVLSDRRSLVEPMQTTWMLAIVLAAVHRGPRALAALAVTTALALTTKASAVAVLPVAVLAPWLVPAARARVDAVDWRRDVLPRVVAVGAGLALAGLAFWLVARVDPAAFRHYWVRTLESARPDADPLAHAGRFGLDPRIVASLPLELLREEPLVFPLALLGALAALRHPALRLPAAWLGCTMLWLAVQIWRVDGHLAITHVPAALLAGLLLTEVATARGAQGTRWGGRLLALMLAAGVGRLVVARSMHHDPSAPAVQWLRGHVPDTAHVVGAPYILMRTRVRAESFTTAGDSSYAPS
ncbi:MAG TPA: hypothetical protein VFX50_00460, partial [Gemmatimonadales bacterium]|nr:hypothetical protein [Gemmatimonadales bacterium]